MRSDAKSLNFSDRTDLSLVSPVFSGDSQFAAPLRLGVLASGSGSNFAAIAQSIANHQFHAEIRVLIYNNPDAKAAVRAEQWQIPAVLLNHRDFASREALDQAIEQTLRQYDVEWVIMAGWMRRVTAALIDAFPDRILNIHPSLLPSFPGIRAIEQALAAGVKITGCTVHYVHLEVDSGPIVMQAAVPVMSQDSVETLHQRIQVQEHRIFAAAIALAAKQQLAIRESLNH
jgi:phosphoribosylglycinamide formyltransferase-1